MLQLVELVAQAKNLLPDGSVAEIVSKPSSDNDL